MSLICIGSDTIPNPHLKSPFIPSRVTVPPRLQAISTCSGSTSTDPTTSYCVYSHQPKNPATKPTPPMKPMIASSSSTIHEQSNPRISSGESSDSADDDFIIPSAEEVKRRCLRLEKKFLQVQCLTLLFIVHSCNISLVGTHK